MERRSETKLERRDSGSAIWRGAWALVAGVLCLVACLPPPLSAQTAQQTAPAAASAPIVAGWLENAPFGQIGDDGEATGFSAAVVRALSETMGVPVELRRFDGLQPRIRAQIDGETTLMTAIARLPALEATNLFSKPVGRTEVRLFVRIENNANPDFVTPVNKRIGTVRQFAGSGSSELLDRNRPVVFENADALLIRLLSGEIDGALLAEDWMAGLAHGVRLDNRIAAVGPPVKPIERVIAIHKSRADLLGPINAAIDTLEANGTLAALRRQWFVDPPPPLPEVLTVGVVNLPPFTQVNDDGSTTGFAVEVIRDLGKLLGLQLQFVPVPPEVWAKGPQGGIDILPLVGITPERRERMDFALPIQAIDIGVFVRSDSRDLFDGLANARVGAWGAGVSVAVARRHSSDVQRFETYAELVTALLDGRIDAILVESTALRRTLSEMHREDRVVQVDYPLETTYLAPALRRGLPSIREALNLVMPGYMASQRYQDLRAAWLEPRGFWTEGRVLSLLAAICGVAVLALGYIPFQRHRIQQERLRFTASMIERIPLGILMVAPNGRIEFANTAARAISPSGPELIREGAVYREVVSALIEADAAHWGTKSPAALAAGLSGPALTDGYSYEFRTTSGQSYRWSSFALTGGSILVMVLNVTRERRHLAEIETLNAELRDQIAIVERTNSELRDFAYATSHDLKSPISTLRLIADALTDSIVGKLPEDDVQLVTDMKEILERMGRMISDVLDYTRAVGGEATVEPVDLCQVAADVLQDLTADIAASGAEIRVGALPGLVGNSRQLHQLLQNLVGNAIKFHRPGVPPRIEIEPVAAPDGMVAFSVSDRGIGIDPKFHRRIFQVFTRLNDTELYPGSGLGLAICQRVSLNHGGRIVVQSAPENGSCFTIFLKEKNGDQHAHDGRRLPVRTEDGKAAY